jgi:hypothetical protein
VRQNNTTNTVPKQDGKREREREREITFFAELFRVQSCTISLEILSYSVRFRISIKKWVPSFSGDPSDVWKDTTSYCPLVKATDQLHILHHQTLLSAWIYLPEYLHSNNKL